MSQGFAELVRTKCEKTKTDYMIDLLPDFDLGMKNGHALSDLCQFLIDTEGPFTGQTLESVKGVYYHARKKIKKMEEKKRGAS